MEVRVSLLERRRWRLRRGWRAVAAVVSMAVLGSGVGAGLAQPPAKLSNAEALAEYGRQLRDRDLPESERLDLIRMFAGWAADQARDPLMAVLDDPSLAIRASAAEALGWPGNTGATRALLERLDDAGEAPAVKAAALRALGRIGDGSARPRVLAATQDADPAIRAAALWAVSLGELKHPGDRTGFLIALARERAADLQVRVQSIQALGQVTRTPEVVVALAGLLEHEPPMPMPLLAPKASQQEVMAARYRQARDVRAWAADSLVRLDARQALPLVLAAAQDRDDYFLRQLSLRVLAVWNEEAGHPILVKALTDPFPDNRQLAVRGLARTRDRQYVPALISRLSDPEIPVRIQAVSAIAYIDDPGAVKALDQVKSKETDPQVMEALEAAITHLQRSR
jgi:HEAT repeat protein